MTDAWTERVERGAREYFNGKSARIYPNAKEFEAAEREEERTSREEERKNSRFNLIPFSELRPTTTPNYLVKGLIPRVGLVVVWGPPKCGKSFWAFDLVMHIADEDMGAYVKAADAIREAFGCVVIIVHHCGVDGTRPRGHTSLTGACDAQLAVKRDGESNFIVNVEHMKDGPEGTTIGCRLERVELSCRHYQSRGCPAAGWGFGMDEARVADNRCAGSGGDQFHGRRDKRPAAGLSGVSRFCLCWQPAWAMDRTNLVWDLRAVSRT